MLGIDPVSSAVVQVARRPAILQPTGTFQGGVVCALGEVAVESVLGAPIATLDTRYLAGIREGSGQATATLLGPSVAQVEVVDTFARTASRRFSTPDPLP